MPTTCSTTSTSCFRDLALPPGAFYRAVLAPIGLSQVQQVIEPDGTGRLIFSTGAPESPFFVVAAGRPTFWN